MEEFIRENPNLVSKILGAWSFDENKLKIIKRLLDNKVIKFNLSNSCPDGIILTAELNEKFNSEYFLKEFLNKRKIFEEEYSLRQSIVSRFCYETGINEGKPSELRIYFYTLK